MFVLLVHLITKFVVKFKTKNTTYQYYQLLQSDHSLNLNKYVYNVLYGKKVNYLMKHMKNSSKKKSLVGLKFKKILISMY